jgi:hypothetical protein
MSTAKELKAIIFVRTLHGLLWYCGFWKLSYTVGRRRGKECIGYRGLQVTEEKVCGI